MSIVCCRFRRPPQISEDTRAFIRRMCPAMGEFCLLGCSQRRPASKPSSQQRMLNIERQKIEDIGLLISSIIPPPSLQQLFLIATVCEIWESHKKLGKVSRNSGTFVESCGGMPEIHRQEHNKWFNCAHEEFAIEINIAVAFHVQYDRVSKAFSGAFQVLPQKCGLKERVPVTECQGGWLFEFLAGLLHIGGSSSAVFFAWQLELGKSARSHPHVCLGRDLEQRI